jgi:nucleoside-diphosphate-sugar epimerase
VRILVTGGLGFIGSHVVDALVERGDDVVVLDSLDPAAHREPPTYVNPRATVHLAPLDDPLALATAVEGVDAVCHQAARVGLGVDFDDVERYVHDNDAGTASLLRALWRRRFAGRLVVASSMVVYGEGRYRCDVHGTVRPGPRAVADLEEGRFAPRCPRCRQELSWPSTWPPRSGVSRARRSSRCATTTCTGHGCPKGAPMQGWRASSAARSKRGGLRRCSRTGVRCGTSSTSATLPGPTCSPSTPT